LAPRRNSLRQITNSLPLRNRSRRNRHILVMSPEPSLQSYGRPRMTEELQELGLNVGHRRVGRLMGENGIKIIRTQKYKTTTDSNHTFNIAPNLLDQDFSADGTNQKWAGMARYLAISVPIAKNCLSAWIAPHSSRCPLPHTFMPSGSSAVLALITTSILAAIITQCHTSY
jgi:hypothetical protein